MITLPNNANKITPIHATTDFFEFTQEEITYIYFDTSLCGAPEPMVNAMIGLKMLEKPTQKLVMINHSIPSGLFPKIQENFEYEVTELSDGNYEMIFSIKEGTALVTDFEDNQCGG